MILQTRGTFFLFPLTMSAEKKKNCFTGNGGVSAEKDIFVCFLPYAFQGSFYLVAFFLGTYIIHWRKSMKYECAALNGILLNAL